MSNRLFYIRCWEDEYPVFVKTLKAVPADKLDYRPHPSSRSAAELVWLQVVEKRSWFELLDTGKMNWEVHPPAMTLDEMIADYLDTHRRLAPRLKKVTDTNWSRKRVQFIVEGKVLLQTSLGHLFWLGLFDAIHHRGQLSTYIRPMGGKVPAIYGLSADDAQDLHTPFLKLT